jgi:hypothetical protein
MYVCCIVEQLEAFFQRQLAQVMWHVTNTHSNSILPGTLARVGAHEMTRVLLAAGCACSSLQQQGYSFFPVTMTAYIMLRLVQQVAVLCLLLHFSFFGVPAVAYGTTTALQMWKFLPCASQHAL